MKIGGKRNAGFGRSIMFAIKNLFRDKYGEGRYSTRHSHIERLRPFVTYLAGESIDDLVLASFDHVRTYAQTVGELFTAGEIKASTAINRISSVNVLMRLLLGNETCYISPKSVIGARSYVRTEEPLGLYFVDFEAAVLALLSKGEFRLAILVTLCRYAGCRFREASLMELAPAFHQADNNNYLSVRKGTKGNRGMYVPRTVPISDRVIVILKYAVSQISEKNLIPAEMSYKQWYSSAHKRWATIAPTLGLSSKFHELRAAYACQRYEELLGEPAPCVSWLGAADPSRERPRSVCGHEALEELADELGHGRIEILKAYVGVIGSYEPEE